MRHVFLALFILVSLGATGTEADIPDTAVTQLLRAHITAVPAPAESAPTLRHLTLPQAVAQFYAMRDYRPAWRNAHLVKQLFSELADMRSDGLNPEDYHLRELQTEYAQLTHGRVDARHLAAFDRLASAAYLRSLANLFRGKVNPVTLDPQWNFSLNNMSTTKAIDIVNTGIDRGDIHPVYARARPQNPIYERTRQALAQLRLIAARGGWPHIRTHTVLKPGVTDPAIAKLRKRFFPDVTAGPHADVYDGKLVAAVKRFQREQYLTVDGIVGPATRAALNVPVQQRIAQVRVNLERERWLLHELHNDFVLVDIAGYKVYFFRNSKKIWQSPVQVGQPYRQTPTFRSKITYVTFNPTWTVPPTILKKDILPKLRANDLALLTENHIRVLDRNGHQLDPATIDWNNPPGDIILRQDAGEDAALGRVAIRFPNPYSVYLHDTPHRGLFKSSVRAFSSGCIRVEHPLQLVELLFNDPQKWNRAAIDELIAEGKTRNITLPKPVPLLLAYWTIDLYDNGDIGFKPDVYKRDKAVLNALNKRL